MRITKKTATVLTSLALSASSLIMSGDSLRLIAGRRVDVMNGIFMLQASVLAAVLFAARARDAKEAWPVSILGHTSR